MFAWMQRLLRRKPPRFEDLPATQGDLLVLSQSVEARIKQLERGTQSSFDNAYADAKGLDKRLQAAERELGLDVHPNAQIRHTTLRERVQSIDTRVQAQEAQQDAARKILDQIDGRSLKKPVCRKKARRGR